MDVHRQTMEIDYFGTLHLVRALLPGMREAGQGRIVLISSGAGLVGIFGYSAYSPAKFAVRGLGEVLRAELKPHGIGVSVVYPPDTDTPQLHEENKVKPAETFAISGNARAWSADDVATCILRGARRGRFTIAPGLEIALLARFHSLVHPLLDRVFDWQAARAARRAGEAPKGPD
jgi:3-dehydrosphinganine reductase